MVSSSDYQTNKLLTQYGIEYLNKQPLKHVITFRLIKAETNHFIMMSI